MSRSRKIIINTITLTAASLVMRGVAMTFQVYLSHKIGAAGIGLFQLIMSIYTLFTTLAMSGIRFTTTRLVSEELGFNPNGKLIGVIGKCIIYALCFGIASLIILVVFANKIAVLWIKDTRSILSLKILSLSLPFISVSSVFSGYFTAVSRVAKSSIIQFFEQFVRIIIVYATFNVYKSLSVEISCAVIVAGGVIGDIFSFIMQFILYKIDSKRYEEQRKANNTSLRILGIALPLAFSSYARTALSTLQQLLIPRGFEKSGASKDKALADYGKIHGMVLPIITFPSALFYSLGDVIVPFLTESQVQKNSEDIKQIVSRILRLCAVFAIGISTVLNCYSKELGMMIYSSEDVGIYIWILSFLMPIMYLDSITDGLLRGLGQHMYSMWVNVVDSLASVMLIYYILPKYAVYGYLFIISFTEIFNFILSIGRLVKITGIRFNFFFLVKTLISAFISFMASKYLFYICSNIIQLVFNITLLLLVYIIIATATGCISKNDYTYIKFLIRKK